MSDISPIPDPLDEEDEILIEDDHIGAAKPAAIWRVLVVDDDEGVHQSTSFAVRDARILGRQVELVHAKSAAEAMAILELDKNFELAIVDVVMEDRHSGLDLTRWMRGKKELINTRILLRTGQPGEVSEDDLLEKYDIDDYRLKSEMSRHRLLAAMTALLKSWSSSRELERSARFMGELAVKAAAMSKAKSREELCVRMAQTIAYLDDIAGVACSLSAKGEAPRWIYAEGELEKPEAALAAFGQEAWDIGQEGEGVTNQTLIAEQGHCVKLSIKSKSGTAMEVFSIFKTHETAWSKTQFLDVLAGSVAGALDALEAMDALARQAFVDEATGLPNEARLRAEMTSVFSSHGSLRLCAIELDDGNGNDQWGYGDVPLAWIKEVAEALHARIEGGAKLFRLGQKSVALVCEGSAEQADLMARQMLEVGKKIAKRLSDLDCHAGIAPCLDYCDADEAVKRVEMAMLEARRESSGEPMLMGRSVDEMEKWKLKAKILETHLHGGGTRPRLAKLVDSEGREEWEFGLDIQWAQAEQGWLLQDKARRMAHGLGLGASYDLAVAKAGLATAAGLEGLVWVELGLESLRQEGFMQQIEQLARSAAVAGKGAALGWIIPEDDPFWGVKGYETWVSELARMGVSLSVSGFGMGYSALSRLGNGPWRSLRLHPSLTKKVDLSARGKNGRLVRAALGLCAAFGFDAVCARPATQESRRELEDLARQAGCDKLWLSSAESHGAGD